MNVVRHHISAGEFEQVIHMFRPGSSGCSYMSNPAIQLVRARSLPRPRRTLAYLRQPET